MFEAIIKTLMTTTVDDLRASAQRAAMNPSIHNPFSGRKENGVGQLDNLHSNGQGSSNHSLSQCQKENQDNGGQTKPLSPAKDIDMINAERRLKEFFAAKNAKMPVSTLKTKLTRSGSISRKLVIPAPTTIPIQSTDNQNPTTLLSSEKDSDGDVSKATESSISKTVENSKAVGVKEVEASSEVMLTVNDTFSLKPEKSESLQISPAKDKDLVEAKKRMDAYLAKVAQKENGNEQLIVDKSHNSSTPGIPLTNVNELEDNVHDKQAEELKTVAIKAVDSRSKSVSPVDKKTDAMARSLADFQISPAKNEELVEAQRKMDAYLAKMANKKIGNEQLIVDKLHNKISPTPGISSTNANELEDNVHDKQAKDFKTVAVKAVDTTSKSVSPVDKKIDTKDKSSDAFQISPAKDKEIVEAQKRMDAYLEKMTQKEKQVAIAKSHNNSTPSVPSNTVNEMNDKVHNKQAEELKSVAVTAVNNRSKSVPSVDKKADANAKSPADFQISPAKDKDLIEAQRKMDIYLASVANKMPSEKQGLTSPANKNSDPEKSIVATGNNLEKKVALEQVDVLKPITFNTDNSSSESVSTGDVFNTMNPANLNISPAKDDDLIEAEKRMNAYMARIAIANKSKKPEDVGTRIIPTKLNTLDKVVEHSTDKNSFLDVNKGKTPSKFSVQKPNGDVSKGFNDLPNKEASSQEPPKTAENISNDEKSLKISPANEEEIAEASRKMEAFLAKRQDTSMQSKIRSAQPPATPKTPDAFVDLVMSPRVVEVITYLVPPNTPAKEGKSETTGKKQIIIDKEEEPTLKILDVKSPTIPAITGPLPTTPLLSSNSSSDTIHSTPKQLPQSIAHNAVNTTPTNAPLLAKTTEIVHSTPERRVFTFNGKEQVEHDTKTSLETPNVMRTPTETTKRPFSTPTKFESSPVVEKCDSIGSPIQTEEPPLPSPVVLPPEPVVYHPGDPKWLEAEMAKLFCRQIPPKGTPGNIPLKRKEVKPPPINLSLSICPNELMAALKDVQEDVEQNMKKMMNSGLTTQLSLVSPKLIKSCLSKPDLFDNVPMYVDPVYTPCQTPVKMQLDKRVRPSRLPFSRKEILRKRMINLAFPQPAKKTVSFANDSDVVSKELTFDDVVNSGGSGFRILSIIDYESNTIRFPKYVPPSDFISSSEN